MVRADNIEKCLQTLFYIGRARVFSRGALGHCLGVMARQIATERVNTITHASHPMSNALEARLMSPAERLDEVAEILAAGLMRLRARKSSPLSGDRGESSLDLLATQSVHAPVSERRGE
jgi:hypothetical protein